MNPWAGLIVLISIGLFVIAYKGTQDNVISAVLGRPYGNSALNSTDVAAGSGPASPTMTPPSSTNPAFNQTSIHDVM